MKTTLLPMLLLLGTGLAAQTFTEVTPTVPFAGFWKSSIAFADVDGDTDLDVFISGENAYDTLSSKLYTNDGAGAFTEVAGTPFVGVDFSAIAVADIDGDNDPDILITGKDTADNRYATLYTNDGFGAYSEVMDTPFTGIDQGSLDFVDVDGDDDLDLLLAGRDSATTGVVKLYRNDGTGTFTEELDTGLPDLATVFAGVADVDGDHDPDLILGGENAPFTYQLDVWLNDGSGAFTAVPDTAFIPLWAGKMDFADVDGDMDLDVLIVGITPDYEETAILYTNDCAGAFTRVDDTPFRGSSTGTVDFADVDGDADQDVLLAGIIEDGDRFTALYTNNGDGTFTPVANTPFTGVVLPAAAFADVDGDTDPDLLLTGSISAYENITKLYTNDLIISSTEEVTREADFAFTLFPNPVAAETLQVSGTVEQPGNISIKVFDLAGRCQLSYQEQASSGDFTVSLDISSLPAGSYFLEMTDGFRQGVQKFQVQH
jgi:hypothetical protein